MALRRLAQSRMWVAAGAVLAALLIVAGASASPRGASRGGVIPLLKIGIPFSFTTLDATKGGNVGRVGSEMGLETLMNMNAQGEVRPWLAQSVSQPGKSVYVYHLRHGVKFWDGNELTADDVANALNYQAYPGSQVAFTYNNVKNIKATDRYTVVVTLKHPDPSWKFDAAVNATLVFEKKFQQAHKSTFGQPGTLVMGTGAYIIDSLDPTTGMELHANPHWWGGKPNIQRISVKFFADENSMALAFRSGAIDIVTYPIGNPKGFAATANARLLTTPSCGVTYFSMPYHTLPWGDVHVRRAVAYAVNRTELINANGGYASPVTTIIVPLMLGTVYSPAQAKAMLKSLPQYPTSLEKAKAELAKSAYPNGFSYTLDEPNLLNLPTIAQAIAGEVKPLGINLTINIVGIGQWIGEIAGAPEKRPATLSSSGCLGPDPSSLDPLLGKKNTKPGQYNSADYDPPAMDVLIAQGETTLDPAKRRVIYQKLLTRMLTDMPYLALYVNQEAYAISSKFSWNPSPYAVYNGTYLLDIKAK
jgi:peptide/nickel transport system substrate-binding protein